MSRSFQVCEATGLDRRIARSSIGEFSVETCSFDISLNNERCSGRGLECLLAWAKGKFDKYEFSLADTLYAASFFEFGDHGQSLPSLEAAFMQARRRGDEWLETNTSIILRQLGSDYRIRRWDEWLRHPELENSIKRVRTLFSHSKLAPLVKADATAYLFRRFGSESVSKQQKQVLIDFMVEECAVYFLHSRDLNVRHVYPGKSLAVLRALSHKDIGLAAEPIDDKEILSVFENMKRTDIDLRFPDAHKV